MEQQFIECGKMVGTHGVKGELKLESWADSPDYLTHFSTLYLEKGSVPLQVLRSRVHKGMLLLFLEGYSTKEASDALRGKIVYIHRKDDPESHLPFVGDLHGMEVVDIDTGASYGAVTEVMLTGAHQVYVLQDKKGVERLVPAVDHVVLETNLEQRIIKIRPLEGLFDLED